MTQLILFLTNIIKSTEFKILGVFLIILIVGYGIYSVYEMSLRMKELKQRIALNERALSQPI